MPKCLFTKLVAVCAIGFLCVLLGCIYGFATKDRILFILSLLIGGCSLIRFLLLFRLIRSKSYEVMTGTCIKREPAFFQKTQQISFRTTDGKEHRFTLEKNQKLLEGHHYRLFFKKLPPERAEFTSATQDFLGFEELSSSTEGLPDQT